MQAFFSLGNVQISYDASRGVCSNR